MWTRPIVSTYREEELAAGLEVRAQTHLDGHADDANEV